MFSTRPSAGAGMKRTTCGTSVPMPRTSRSIWPRLTVSMTAVERSSVGAAGLSLVSPKVMPPMASSPTPMKIAVRMRFFSLDFPVRLISINSTEN